MATKTVKTIVSAPPSALTTYRPGLPAIEVHEHLCEAVTEMRLVEQNAVFWFSEVLRRKLFRELGYASIHAYGSEALGFSRSKVYHFIRLSEAFADLPRLKQAVTTGQVPWTKAREIVSVATKTTEARWVKEAKSSSRRELEEKVAETKRRAVAVRGSKARRQERAGQATLALAGPAGKGSGDAGAPTDGGVTSGCAPRDDLPIEVPVTMQLRLSPIQAARLEALIEKSRSQGHRESREELILGALEELVSADYVRVRDERRAKGKRGGKRGSSGKGSKGSQAAGASTGGEKSRPLHSPYQVVVYTCETCGRAHVPTFQGNREIDMATLEAVMCDCRISEPGKRNRSTIPPSVRRTVFERDGYRCTVAGCGSRHELLNHHEIRVTDGGSDDIENLRAMCGSCHRWLHRNDHKPTTSESPRGDKSDRWDGREDRGGGHESGDDGHADECNCGCGDERFGECEVRCCDGSEDGACGKDDCGHR